MGFSDLRLVSPPKGWLAKSKKMSMSAYDVAKKARVFKTLSGAVADLKITIGTTRRYGPKRGMFLPLDKAMSKAGEIARGAGVGFVFGKESKGMDNSSLKVCDWVTTIPANPEYPSLNLSQAVLLMAWELSRFFAQEKLRYATEMEFVSKEEVAEVMSRFKKALHVLGYDKPGKTTLVDRIGATFNRLLKRSGLLHCEAQMLRGLSRRIQERTIGQAGKALVD